MGDEKCRKGNRTMMNGNYYHRTHKNHKPDTRGKVDHTDNPANLFRIQNTDKEIFDIDDFVDGVFYVNLNELFKENNNSIVMTKL